MRGGKDQEGNFSQPISMLRHAGRVTGAELEMRRRLSKDSAVEEPDRKRGLCKAERFWIGTAGIARTPNPVAKAGAGIANETHSA